MHLSSTTSRGEFIFRVQKGEKSQTLSLPKPLGAFAMIAVCPAVDPKSASISLIQFLTFMFVVAAWGIIQQKEEATIQQVTRESS